MRDLFQKFIARLLLGKKKSLHIPVRIRGTNYLVSIERFGAEMDFVHAAEKCLLSEANAQEARG